MADGTQRVEHAGTGREARAAGRGGAVAGGGVRVSDEDRRRTADRLARAQADGRLGLGEFDERVRAAYAAVVRADLEPLTADLPVDAPEPLARSRARGSGPDRTLRAAVAVWAVVSLVNLAIWTVVALAASGPVYPWWIWVAGPWGAVLAMHALVGRHLPRPGMRGMPGLPGPMMLPTGPCGIRPRR